MESNSIRPIRKVAISDKLWDCFDQMAKEMGNDRDGLINQALFSFARLNGYLTPGFSAPAEAASPPHSKPEAAVSSPPARREPVEAPAAPSPPPPRRTATADHDSALRRQTAPPPPPPAPARVTEPPSPASSLEDDPERREAAVRVLETASALERSLKDKDKEKEKEKGDERRDGPTRDGHAAAKEPGESGALYLMAEDGNLDKVVKDRFVIGRGKHCDLVINSGKVSREHAAIVREGTEFFIEDLGSSNGTWFQKQRIRRRKIEDGDEYFICSEKVKCVVR